MSDFYDLTPDAQARRLEEAGRQALRHWNINPSSMRLIKYRENAVFEIREDSRRHALRTHRIGYHSDAELQSELHWMVALAQSGIETPTVIPTNAGELFVTHESPDLPGPVQVDLFEWLDGEQLGSIEDGLSDASEAEKAYKTIGEIAAQVHNQASDWTLPEGYARHAWDEHGLAGSAPFWGQYWKLEAASPAQRNLLERARDRVFSDLSDLPKSPDVYSMIHADFVPENLLVSDGRVRLIDFDDAGFGWHLFELSTSLFFIRHEPYYEQAKQALIEGYRTHRALSDEQLALLPLFDLARSTTYVGWVHTRPETETAQELTPILLEWACELSEAYLS